MAEIVRYVDPDATGAGNGTSWTDAYTSLNAWEAAEQQDLTDGGGDTMVCHCRCSSGTDDTTSVTVDGFTTSAAYYVSIDVDSGSRHAGKFDATKFLLKTATSPMVISDSYIRVSGLQIECTYSSGDSNRTLLYISTPTCRVSHCILKWGGTGTGTNRGLWSAGNVAAEPSLIWNCIAYNTDDEGFKFAGENSSVDCWNCTAVDCGMGFGSGYNDADLSMCLASDCTDCFEAGSFNSADHCAYTEGADPGTNGHSVTRGTEFAFVDYAGDDFHLTASFDGTTDPSGGIVTDDIDGDERTGTFDIGADEYVSGAPGGANYVPIIYHMFRMRAA